jgi:hypothetical protein
MRAQDIAVDVAPLRWREDICAFLHDKQRAFTLSVSVSSATFICNVRKEWLAGTPTWFNTIGSTLSQQSALFESHGQGTALSLLFLFFHFSSIHRSSDCRTLS